MKTKSLSVACLVSLFLCVIVFQTHAHAQCMTGTWVDQTGVIFVLQQDGTEIRGLATASGLWPWCYFGLVGQYDAGAFGMWGRASEGCGAGDYWVYLTGRTDCQVGGYVFYPGGSSIITYMQKIREGEKLTGLPEGDEGFPLLGIVP